MTTAKTHIDCPQEIEQECISCRKKCTDCPHCYDVGAEKIKEYLSAIDDKISDYSKSKLCIESWGYACSPVTESQFEKLIIFRDYIDYYHNTLRLNFDSGFCPNEIQSVLEAVSKLINTNTKSCNVHIDDSNFENWIISNPYCVAWEDWEYSVAKICPKVGIEVVNLKDTCNFIFDIKVDKIKQSAKFLYTLSVATVAKYTDSFDKRFGQLLGCDIDYNATVKVVETCKLGADIKVQLKECKTDFDTLVKKHECDLDFNTYVALLKCNLSHQAITNLIECDVNLGYSVEQKCPTIITGGNEYSFENLKVNLLTSDVDSSILIDKKEFDVETLISTYSNSELIKDNING